MRRNVLLCFVELKLAGPCFLADFLFAGGENSPENYSLLISRSRMTRPQRAYSSLR